MFHDVSDAVGCLGRRAEGDAEDFVLVCVSDGHQPRAGFVVRKQLSGGIDFGNVLFFLQGEGHDFVKSPIKFYKDARQRFASVAATSMRYSALAHSSAAS